MSSSGTVPLKDVWAMLDACANGYTKRQGQHNWVVMYDGKTFPNLPLGPHGKRHNPDIQIGKIKQMVRLFGIYECAKGHIARL
jgi:hypothetical protein